MPTRVLRAAAPGSLALLAGCALVGSGVSSPARGPIHPRNGLEVIGAIKRAHPSRELRTLAFTVRTTEHRPAGERVVVSRMYARLPGKHRVTRLPTSLRSGTVRDRQWLSVFERGERVASVRRWDIAALLAYDIFGQSLDTTIMWLDSARIRYAIARPDYFQGQDVWVVGAEDGDNTTPQFWVDAIRWRLVRVIQRDPRRPDDVLDIRFTDFQEFLDVPLPVRLIVHRDGRLAETQEISQVTVNPRLSTRIFDLNRP
jgi:hypothetical protein